MNDVPVPALVEPEVQRSSSLAASDALRRAVSFAGPALSAMSVAALAALLMVVGALAVLARGALLMVVESAPAVARVFLAGALVAVVAWAWPVAWYAFGGDVAAMLPASMLVVVPVVWALVRRAGWHGLMAAVFVVAGLAAVLSVVTRSVAHLLLVVLLVASVFQSVSARR